MKPDKIQRIIITIVIIIAAIIAAILPWKCNAQGTIVITFEYDKIEEDAFIWQYGSGWAKEYITPRLQRAWKNHKNTAIGKYKQSLSDIFVETDETILTNKEKQVLMKTIDSVIARRERKIVVVADNTQHQIGKSLSHNELRDLLFLNWETKDKDIADRIHEAEIPAWVYYVTIAAALIGAFAVIGAILS